MRVPLFASLPLLAAFAVTPASGQIGGWIHIDLPIGHHPPVVVHRPPPPPREVIVVPYDAHRFGDWSRNERKWSRITLYVLNGRFFERPWGNARAVEVYRYRNRYFFPPRDRDWDRYRNRNPRWDRDHDDHWNDDRDGLRPVTPYYDRARPRF